MSIASKAFYLPGQLDRVTGMAYTDNPLREMQGGYEIQHNPTRAFLFKNMWQTNNSLYRGRWRIDLRARKWLSRAQKLMPPMQVEVELDRASIYSTYDGNEFFGLWLTDDCPAYSLAANEGTPLTCLPAGHYPHQLEYHTLWGMNPVRAQTAYLKEAVIVHDDWSYGKGKHARFGDLRSRLLARMPHEPHPGVFILRRDSGNSRIMRNELEVAEYLREKRGFKVMDVTQNTATEILTASAGARVVAGVEGSQIINGLMVLNPGASLLALQPPNRFCCVIKKATDMEGIHYAFVVGTPTEQGFEVDTQEIERTLDLLPVAA
ncbi:glycosyltransferase family 61 protein [Variovorax sp. J22P168]|nr:glycosyltransferase family 61 protein [Variovorax sp. J22P168]